MYQTVALPHAAQQLTGSCTAKKPECTAAAQTAADTQEQRKYSRQALLANWQLHVKQYPVRVLCAIQLAQRNTVSNTFPGWACGKE
jgi:hypothetical protein